MVTPQNISGRHRRTCTAVRVCLMFPLALTANNEHPLQVNVECRCAWCGCGSHKIFLGQNEPSCMQERQRMRAVVTVSPSIRRLRLIHQTTHQDPDQDISLKNIEFLNAANSIVSTTLYACTSLNAMETLRLVVCNTISGLSNRRSARLHSTPRPHQRTTAPLPIGWNCRSAPPMTRAFCLCAAPLLLCRTRKCSAHGCLHNPRTQTSTEHTTPGRSRIQFYHHVN